MIADSNLQFSSAQAITGSSSAIDSTNYVDFGSPRNIGVGAELTLVVDVTTTLADSSSDSAVVVALVCSAATGFGTPTTTTLITIPALTVAGTRFLAKIPQDVLNLRYAKLTYKVSDDQLSAGAVTAEIVKDYDDYTSYASGFTVI